MVGMQSQENDFREYCSFIDIEEIFTAAVLRRWCPQKTTMLRRFKSGELYGIRLTFSLLHLPSGSEVCFVHVIKFYRFSRSGPLSRGFFGEMISIHIFGRWPSALINELGASIASSLWLASFSTPQLRHRWVNADATAEWDNLAFSSERFE